MIDIERYNKIFREILNISSEETPTELNLKKTAQWDSVSHLNLVMAMEEEFDVMFDADDILGFDSYNHGISILNKYGIYFEGIDDNDT